MRDHERTQVMPLHAPRETIESLRLTLESLEQEADPAADAQDVAEFKRILLTRIADLEALEALNAQSSVVKTPDDPPDATPADLPPVDLVAADEPTERLTTQPEPPPPAA